MRLAYILLLTMLLSVNAEAQHTLQGEVCMEDGNGLPSSIIRLYTKEGKSISYAITNQNGHFRCSLSEGTTLPLTAECSHIGYKKTTAAVSAFSKKLRFTMVSNSIVIKEVTIRSTPIKSRGDTLDYNVAAFKKPSDRTLEDILKRLPGIQVDASGKILYQGESINKFYIEGLDLLSGRYALATRNITPDDVSTVSVYENHQPLKMLKDVEFSEKAALNIKLKSNRKLKPFGYASVGSGAGDKALWQGDLFCMFAGSRGQTLFFANGNNTGKTLSDNLTNYTTEMSKQSTFGNYVQEQPFATEKTQKNRYEKNRSLGGTANTIRKSGKNSTLTLNASYDANVSEYETSKSTTYFLLGGNSILIKNSNTSDVHTKKACIDMKYELNADKRYLTEQLSLNGRFVDNTFNVTETQDLRQDVNKNDYSVSNLLNYCVKINNHIISFKSTVGFQRTPQGSLYAFYIDNDSMIVNQRMGVTSFHTNEKTGYTWILNGTSKLGVDFTFDSFYGKIDKSIKRTQDYLTEKNDGYKLETVLVPHYLYEKGRMSWSLSMPITMYNMSVSNADDGSKEKFNKLYLAVSSQIGYHYKGFRTTLKVGYDHQIGTITDYMRMMVYSNYRNMSYLGTGKPSVGNRLNFSSTLSYRNSIDGFFATLQPSYLITERNVIANSNVSSDKTVMQPLMKKNLLYKPELQFSLSKVFYSIDLSVSLTGNFSWIRYDMLRMGNYSELHNRMQNICCDIRKSFLTNRIIASVSYDVLRSVRNIAQENDYRQLNHRLNASVSFFVFKDLEVYMNEYYTMDDAMDTRCSYFLLDGGVRYKKKKMEMELKLSNITNRRQYSYSQINDLDHTVTSYSLRPFEAVVSLKFSF